MLPRPTFAPHNDPVLSAAGQIVPEYSDGPLVFLAGAGDVREVRGLETLVTVPTLLPRPHHHHLVLPQTPGLDPVEPGRGGPGDHHQGGDRGQPLVVSEGGHGLTGGVRPEHLGGDGAGQSGLSEEPDHEDVVLAVVQGGDSQPSLRPLPGEIHLVQLQTGSSRRQANLLGLSGVQTGGVTGVLPRHQELKPRDTGGVQPGDLGLATTDSHLQTSDCGQGGEGEVSLARLLVSVIITGF